MEEWRDIKGYEGIYQVSNRGRVRRIVATHTTKPMMRKASLQGRGYLGICLSKNGVTKRYIVSRLVAEAFIPNPDNKPEVNHINGIKTDNRAVNLEWVTVSENKLHAYRTGLHDAELQKRRVPVIAYDLQGNKVGIFASQLEASKALGVSQGSITRAIHTGYRAGKYRFKYANESHNRDMIADII